MESEQDIAGLLKLYQSSLQAHFEHDAQTFLAEYASRWYDVRNGTVRLRTKEEARPQLEAYFKQTHFHDISEITPPTVHVSLDATMAWMLAEIRVRADQTQPDGTVRDCSFRCAWVSIYEKNEQEWAQIVNASSFRFVADAQEESREPG
jgi:hypothetical protein